MKKANLIIKLEEILKNDAQKYTIDTNNPQYITIHRRTFYGFEVMALAKLLKRYSWWITYSLTESTAELNIAPKNYEKFK